MICRISAELSFSILFLALFSPFVLLFVFPINRNEITGSWKISFYPHSLSPMWPWYNESQVHVLLKLLFFFENLFKWKYFLRNCLIWGQKEWGSGLEISVFIPSSFAIFLPFVNDFRFLKSVLSFTFVSWIPPVSSTAQASRLDNKTRGEAIFQSFPVCRYHTTFMDWPSTSPVFFFTTHLNIANQVFNEKE